MEKVFFANQILPHGEPESSLEAMQLSPERRKEVDFSTLVAEHSLDYGGPGTGELFFPIETGEFEAPGASGFMERDWDTK